MMISLAQTSNRTTGLKYISSLFSLLTTQISKSSSLTVPLMETLPYALLFIIIRNLSAFA